MFLKGNDGLQNMFIYQLTFNSINIKQVNDEYNIFGLEIKRNI